MPIQIKITPSDGGQSPLIFLLSVLEGRYFPSVVLFWYSLLKGADPMGFMLILIAIIFFSLGILSKRNPTWGWRANEAWKIKGDSEPSDAYIDDMKFRGSVRFSLGSSF
ncbi:hypothetical protein JOE49_004012 [Paenibacillus sp. PvR133]|uniref:DUF6199 family natural product biosynthesis protein n=1 Tax=Paenibacillus sp. PvR133 TaxID=2806598 RepID=UPI001B580AC9|nr:DUF6199 family natural product biosynthesis protein [Paenibacillus sp. PvR133]MBP1176760.1 hypothetical protein [Paenibacillus sp. PvR133]